MERRQCFDSKPECADGMGDEDGNEGCVWVDGHGMCDCAKKAGSPSGYAHLEAHWRDRRRRVRAGERPGVIGVGNRRD